MVTKISGAAGHALVTSGKRTPDGEREWSFNDKVLRAFAQELANYEGVEFKRFDDPTGKVDIPLVTRSNNINAWKPDLHIDFHHNALAGKWGSHTGIETFVYLGNTNTKSGAIAKLVHPALVKAYGLRDRGLKEGNLHMVRETKCPAILIEGGFMDSTIDIVKLRDDAVLASTGVAVAQAVAKYFNLKRKAQKGVTPTVSKPTPTPKPTPSTKKDYEGHWSEPSIQKALKNDIMKGYENGNFGPNDTLTRGQFVSVLDKLGLLDKKVTPPN